MSRWWWGLVPLIALVPDAILANPTPVRVAWAALLGVVLALLMARPAWTDRLWALAGRRPAPWLLVGGWVAVGVAFSLRRHAVFGDPLAFDVAYHAQVLWNTLHGASFEGTILQELHFEPPLRHHFGLHFSPALALLLPAYAVAPSAATLGVAKVLATAVSALFLHRFAERTLGAAAATFVCIAYLLHPTVLAQTLHAFYPVILAMPLLMWAWCEWDARNPWRFAAVVIAFLCVREDLGLTLAAFGMVWLVERRAGQKRSVAWGVAPVVAGLAWYGLSAGVIMPFFGGGGSGQSTLSWFSGFGDSAPEIARRILTDPVYTLSVVLGSSKALYLWRMIRPWALTPFLGAASLLALPTAAINLLATRPDSATADPTEHYSAVFAVALALGAVGALTMLRQRRGEGALRNWVLAILFLSASAWTDGLPSGELATLRERPQHATIVRALAQIPEGVAVAAPGYTLVHLPNRRLAYASERIGQYPEFRPDYALFDVDPARFYLVPGTEDAYRARIDRFRADPTYELVIDEAGMLLFRLR